MCALVSDAAPTLQEIEVIKDVTIVDVPWTMENGLLTPTLKKKRPALQARYAEALSAMAAKGIRRQPSRAIA